MTGAALATGTRPQSPHLLLSIDALRLATLWLMIFGGSIVMFRPSPYELLGAIALIVWLATGLRFTREMVPITLLMTLYMTGASFALIPVMQNKGTVLWTAIGWYMALSAIFFMMVLAEDTRRRMDVIANAYVATAILCSVIGILAYARLLPAADQFLRYGRVKGTFDDPNVFGPFLVLPALILLQRIYLDGLRRRWLAAAGFVILLAGVFLSFSRGAWGHIVFSAGLMTLLTVLASCKAPALRARIVLVTCFGVAACALLFAVLLSFDSVHELFRERASLEQAYDVGEFGRFNRHWLGFVMALDHPNGIGIFEFAKLYGEDTHNSYLNAFLSYGWLGGVMWPAIVVSTLVAGWRWCLTPSPWRHYMICIMATFQVVVLEAWIIDIDHWRHAWFLLGAVWGLSIATARYQRTRSGRPASSRRAMVRGEPTPLG